MSLAVARTPTRVDLAWWDDVMRLREDAFELVEGVPTMAPEENVDNRAAGTALAFELRRQGVDAGFATDVEVTLTEVPATVRRPDVVVFDRGVLGAQRPIGAR